MELNGEAYNKRDCLKQTLQYVKQENDIQRKELINKMSAGFYINRSTAKDWLNTLDNAGCIEDKYEGLEITEAGKDRIEMYEKREKMV